MDLQTCSDVVAAPPSPLTPGRLSQCYQFPIGRRNLNYPLCKVNTSCKKYIKYLLEQNKIEFVGSLLAPIARQRYPAPRLFLHRGFSDVTIFFEPRGAGVVK